MKAPREMTPEKIAQFKEMKRNEIERISNLLFSYGATDKYVGRLLLMTYEIRISASLFLDRGSEVRIMVSDSNHILGAAPVFVREFAFGAFSEEDAAFIFSSVYKACLKEKTIEKKGEV